MGKTKKGELREISPQVVGSNSTSPTFGYTGDLSGLFPLLEQLNTIKLTYMVEPFLPEFNLYDF